MLIMAEVTSEMGAELRASAMARKTSVAAEVGRRLERLERLEAEDSGGSMRFGDRLMRALAGSPDGRVTIVSVDNDGR